MFIPWIELATESAQLAVRLRKAWGAGANGAAPNLESWKIISADANEADTTVAPKVRKASRGQKSASRGARTVSKRAAKSSNSR
jgi:hypothetical protein